MFLFDGDKPNFAQTTIDTLSVTIYPEFSYPGVAIEYKFDKFGSDEIEFPVSSDIDSSFIQFLETD